MVSKCGKCGAALRLVSIIIWLEEAVDDPIVSNEEYAMLVKRERTREEYGANTHSPNCPFRSEDE